MWDVIANYANDLHWRAGLLKMSPDPAGLPRNGTRVHEELRMAGRTYVNDVVVSDVVDGVSYRFAGSGTSGDVQGGRRVSPTENPNEATFTYEIDLVLRGATRLIKPLVAATMGASLRKDLATLKNMIEAGDLAPR